MTEKNKRQIIVDCDPGVDDAFALAMAFAEDALDVLAIHTVAGNVPVEHTTKNARGLVQLLGVDVPISKGATAPLLFEPHFAAEVHGKNGFGEVELTDLAPLSPLTAMESYVKILSEAEEKVSIVAIGPLTNVALLIKSYPELLDKIDCISLMGGGLKGGNTTSAGEFNFFYDPHAAHIVLNSGVPIIMSGLDATEQSTFRQSDANILKEKGGELGRLLHDISQSALRFHKEANHTDYMNLHDVMSVLYLVYPEFFTTKDAFVKVAYDEGVMRGFSHEDVRLQASNNPNAKVMVGLDDEKIIRKVLQTLTDKDVSFT
ncbi:MAG: nucleoside hydrolase [Alkalibacterium sp.]|uniref:Pyrimidine-specific ribonucleoside hydrolase n=1 Tax=Alkalibacterium gilvum TaxID=1130080 RepID=A0A1H6V296_9LACT|nr:nucleoside hydrolase [Alkalibacterium sp.]SEI98703.1 pyrimidine-specific ribonucleoside hydrolase [Alkalibacterium gilvum]MDN6293387.1 nucleoside hydrolase [Alkalibacterium sp.]MDN6295334.1 nucleoside hydrolase [Alkalibacterium sp.]MDN6327467.1 nucleoside hydrolase [Alkalibacterium sp.]MDN6385849.1 nucleoside hydrolase [Alkalibacterium sp.]